MYGFKIKNYAAYSEVCSLVRLQKLPTTEAFVVLRKYREIMKYVFILFFSLIYTLSAHADRYGIYSLAAQGSSRVLGMGGAFTGVADDWNAVIFNPAGLVFAPSWASLGSDRNHVYNLESDLNNDGLRDGVPNDYFSYAGALQLSERLALGFGYSSPYFGFFEFSGLNAGFTETRRAELSLRSYDLALGVRLLKSLSFGFTGQWIRQEQNYEFFSTNPASARQAVSTKDTKPTFKLGMMFKPSESFSMGLSFQPQLTYHVESGLNAPLNGVNWFRSTVRPAKVSLGTSIKPTDHWIIGVDVDTFMPVGDAVMVGSELVTGFKRASVRDEVQVVLRGGTEWHLLDTKILDIYLRGGIYHEPSRIVGGVGRMHKTVGIGLRPLIFLIEAAIDDAPDYLNAVFGIGFSLRMF